MTLYGGGGGTVPIDQNVVNVRNIAVVTGPFLSHLQRLVDVKVRWGEKRVCQRQTRTIYP